MKHLLLFAIGPVQSFISQARKTHDLYAGSKLLSDLVKAAVDVVGQKNLIFPKLGPAMPNRFLAEIPEEIIELKSFGENVEYAVRNKWKKIANDSLIGVGEKPSGFDDQINEFLEIYWTIEPLGEDYKSVLEISEQNIAAIKNIRSFQQFKWQQDFIGERGRKCSLDGQRNVQFYRSTNGKEKSVTASPLYSTEGSVLMKSQFPEAVLQPGEGLSAVSFVKRRYQYNDRESFKSTTEIALFDALRYLRQNDAGKILLKEYEEHVFNNFNAQLFYEDSITNDFLKKQGIELRQGYSLESVIRKRNQLYDLSRPYKFQKYYSILTFDGDDMGKWLSGEYILDKSNLKRFQIKFAECLADFAKKAKDLLDQNSGQTVYAGGDDFLGFVNMNHLLPFLKELKLLFHEIVNLPLSPFVENNKHVSFSAGICIAHYREPLTLVIQEAKRAQEKAKDLADKNSFSISVIKGSGESHYSTIPFGTNAESIDNLLQIVNALAKDEFSNNFIKNIQSEFARVITLGELAAFESMFRAELNRLLIRASNITNKMEKKRSAENATKVLMQILGNREPHNFFQMLHITDFLHREMDIPENLSKTE